MQFELKVTLPEDQWTYINVRYNRDDPYMFHDVPVGTDIIDHVRRELELPELSLDVFPDNITNCSHPLKTTITEARARAALDHYRNQSSITVTVNKEILTEFLTVRIQDIRNRDGGVANIYLYHDIKWDVFIAEWAMEGYPLEWTERVYTKDADNTETE